MRTKKKKLSQSDLRALGVQPGLMARRYDRDGRAHLVELAPDTDGRRRDVATRLADETTLSEGG